MNKFPTVDQIHTHSRNMLFLETILYASRILNNSISLTDIFFHTYKKKRRNATTSTLSKALFSSQSSYIISLQTEKTRMLSWLENMKILELSFYRSR